MPKRVDIPFPFGGLNTNASALRQVRGTTRRMQNALPRDWRANGIRRGAQIPGLSKFVDEQLAAATVQSLVSAESSFLGTTIVDDPTWEDSFARDTSYGTIGDLDGDATADYRLTDAVTVVGVGTTMNTAGSPATGTYSAFSWLAAYSGGSPAGRCRAAGYVEDNLAVGTTAGATGQLSAVYFRPSTGGTLPTDNFFIRYTITIGDVSNGSNTEGAVGFFVNGSGTIVNGGAVDNAFAVLLTKGRTFGAIPSTSHSNMFLKVGSIVNNTTDDDVIPVTYTTAVTARPQATITDSTLCDPFDNAWAAGSKKTLELRKNGNRVEFRIGHGENVETELYCTFPNITLRSDTGGATAVQTSQTEFGFVFFQVSSTGTPAFTKIEHLEIGTCRLNTDTEANVKVVSVIDGDVLSGTRNGFTAASGGANLYSADSSVMLVRGLGQSATSGTQYVYALDGTNYYKIAVGSDVASVSAWAATGGLGSLPAGSTDATKKATYGVVWRNRIVLFGVYTNPDNWYMSRVGAPNDWLYTSSTDPSRRAVAGDTSDTGLLPVPIRCMAPFDADRLIVAGADRMWAMVGDPMLGGQFFAVSDRIGICGPRGYARDSAGNLYFAFYDGIYTMRRGTLDPIPISGGVIDSFFDDIDFSENDIHLAWSRYMDGLFVFVVPADGSNHDHLFWDGETRGWSTVTLPDDFGPSAICVYNDTRSMNDRGGDAILLGGFDGYIRQFDSDADDFDGEPIESVVDFAPMVSDGHAMPSLELVEPIFGSNTTGAYIDMRRARTAEALSSVDAVASKMFTSSGRRSPWFVRSTAAAIGLSIRGAGKRGSGKYWSLEGLSGEGGGSGQIGRVSS